MNTMNPTIVYLRISTAEQETDSQEHQVLEFCRVRGWQSPLIVRDMASGAVSSRPGLEDMLNRVRQGCATIVTESVLMETSGSQIWIDGEDGT
jgi:DNA invertase Pin-like site-specific DNA recombinase